RRALSGLSAEVFLDTVGRSDEDKRLLDLVLVPPDGAVAMSSFVVFTTFGQGMDQIYKDLPPPARVTGLVTSPLGGPAGVRADIIFDGDQMRVAGEPDLAPYLRYRTGVHTDAHGRYATILPPGRYKVYIDPDQGQGWGKNTPETVEIVGDVVLSLRPVPPLTLVTGNA